jgi:hypothetical protein
MVQSHRLVRCVKEENKVDPAAVKVREVLKVGLVAVAEVAVGPNSKINQDPPHQRHQNNQCMVRKMKNQRKTPCTRSWLHSPSI